MEIIVGALIALLFLMLTFSYIQQLTLKDKTAEIEKLNKKIVALDVDNAKKLENSLQYYTESVMANIRSVILIWYKATYGISMTYVQKLINKYVSLAQPETIEFGIEGDEPIVILDDKQLPLEEFLRGPVYTTLVNAAYNTSDASAYTGALGEYKDNIDSILKELKT